MNNKELGRIGEERALNHLFGCGYDIVDTNVRPIPGMARGEIDIVAWNEGCLCFVEVKLRRTRGYTPSDVVNVVKRRQLSRLAQAYLNRCRLEDVVCRFDVIMVDTSPTACTSQCTLYKDAFRPYDL